MFIGQQVAALKKGGSDIELTVIHSSSGSSAGTSYVECKKYDNHTLAIIVVLLCLYQIEVLF